MKETGAEYAVKIMEKRHIKKEKKVKFVMTEKSILSKISHPKIIKLHMTFQVCCCLLCVNTATPSVLDRVTLAG
jgi:serine/threonine protein kinase